jgi:hypothetical protein
VKDLVVERLSRKVRRERPHLTEQKLLEWIESPEPEITLEDLPKFTAERIEDFEELL